MSSGWRRWCFFTLAQLFNLLYTSDVLMAFKDKVHSPNVEQYTEIVATAKLDRFITLLSYYILNIKFVSLNGFGFTAQAINTCDNSKSILGSVQIKDLQIKTFSDSFYPWH